MFKESEIKLTTTKTIGLAASFDLRKKKKLSLSSIASVGLNKNTASSHNCYILYILKLSQLYHYHSGKMYSNSLKQLINSETWNIPKSKSYYLQKLFNCQVTDTTKNTCKCDTSAGKCCHLRQRVQEDRVCPFGQD